MFRKLIEKRKKINAMKKDCFEARQNLVVACNDTDDEKVGCIKLKYSVASCIQNAWVADINPEDTFRVVGPRISYCFSFDAKDPSKHPCHCLSCPMYRKYEKYLQTYKTLQSVKGKTK